MKKVLTTIIVMIIIILAGITYLYPNVSVTMKSSQITYIEQDGKITAIKFQGPFEHNKIEYSVNTEEKYDENGKLVQMINYYDEFISKKSRLPIKEQVITIEVSNSVEYVYNLEFSDKTIIISDGVLLK